MFLKIFVLHYEYTRMSAYPFVNAGACRVKEKALEPKMLELQAVVNHLTWVLGTRFRSSARAEHSQPLSHLPRPVH